MNEDNEQTNVSEDKEQTLPEKKQRLKKKKKVKTKDNKKKKKKGLHIGISTLVLIGSCIFLLVVSTFLQLNVTHFIIPSKLFSGQPCKLEDFLFTIKYIPQIPAALFVAGLLGRRFGITAIICYIIAGLFFVPVFALGGGWRYIFEYGFGYILSYIPAAFLLGTMFKKGYTYKNVIKSVILSVLLIHLGGILYMLCLAGLKHAGGNFIAGWIAAQSGLKILYDIVFSILAVLVSKYARIILWCYL